MTRETCEICRFDSDDYTTDDVIGTLLTLEPWWLEAVRDIDPEVLNTRPAPTVWAPSEYAQHTSGVTWALAEGLEQMRAGATQRDPIAVPDASADDPPPDIDTAECIAEIGRQAQRMAAIVRELGDERLLALTGQVGDRTIDGAWLVRHAVHDATHHLSDTGRDLYALVGASAPPAFGRVESVNVSDGGVPKRPVATVRIGRRGLEGDRQRSRKHHGRVWQALCLYSIDVIEALQEEGHPIQGGSAGENLTLRGIDWVTMRPGVRLQLGDAVAELTVPAAPCRHNAQWFADGDFRRMDHERYPGWSRWYAKVVRDGPVSEGDQVIVDP